MQKQNVRQTPLLLLRHACGLVTPQQKSHAQSHPQIGCAVIDKECNPTQSPRPVPLRLLPPAGHTLNTVCQLIEGMRCSCRFVTETIPNLALPNIHPT